MIAKISLLFVTGLMISGSLAMADNMTCRFQALRATQLGVRTDDSNSAIALTAKITKFNDADRSTNLLKNCISSVIQNLPIEFCAYEDFFNGGYVVALHRLDAGKDDFPSTIAAYTLGTSRNSRGLMTIKSSEKILDSVVSKMKQAGIRIPSDIPLDTYQLDKQIAKGLQKGAIATGDFLSLSLIVDEFACSINASEGL